MIERKKGVEDGSLNKREDILRIISISTISGRRRNFPCELQKVKRQIVGSKSRDDAKDSERGIGNFEAPNSNGLRYDNHSWTKND